MLKSTLLNTVPLQKTSLKPDLNVGLASSAFNQSDINLKLIIIIKNLGNCDVRFFQGLEPEALKGLNFEQTARKIFKKVWFFSEEDFEEENIANAMGVISSIRGNLKRKSVDASSQKASKTPGELGIEEIELAEYQDLLKAYDLIQKCIVIDRIVSGDKFLKVDLVFSLLRSICNSDNKENTTQANSSFWRSIWPKFKDNQELFSKLHARDSDISQCASKLLENDHKNIAYYGKLQGLLSGETQSFKCLAEEI